MNTLYWLVGIIVTAILLAALWFFVGSLRAPIQTQDNTNSNTNPLPNNSSSGGSVTIPTPTSTSTPAAGQQTVAVPTRSGSTIVVKDFLHNGITVSDVVNPGHYYLVGSVGYCLADKTCPTAGDEKDFSISYSTTDLSFNIVLTEEPLADVREKAEKKLMEILGLTQSQMCNLVYFVVTPYWVNEIYTGKNLGFSFCPGAVAL